MEPRLAIHHRPGGWSDKWIEYCDQNGVSYSIVDCYDSDIIQSLKAFNGFLWQFAHWVPEDILIARCVITAAEQMGLNVFPNTMTCWHFDDKVAQKYLLEAVDAPLAPTHVFYDKRKALQWLRQADYPLVAKLRRGAGSFNVRLLRSYRQALRYCTRMFGRGYSPIPGYFADVKTKLRKIRGWKGILNRVGRTPAYLGDIIYGKRFFPKEKGYVSFQQFIPGNVCDIRISVIGNRAWGFVRGVRKNDWRASGSGTIDYDVNKVPLNCVKIAFSVANSIRSQSTAFDFVRDADGNSYIVEISYGYVGAAVYQCSGYWDQELNWHEGHIWPEHASLIDLLSTIEKRTS